MGSSRKGGGGGTGDVLYQGCERGLYLGIRYGGGDQDEDVIGFFDGLPVEGGGSRGW